ncbi:MC/SLC25 family protein, partial [Klebsiella pneumoniae]|uniref:MC/SLC25 family protein n=1 Tax=Klebsiella pneumoniae TaxID=573 RepID=UPI0034DF4CA7
MDAFQKIIHSDGLRGLYRGFGVSILTYAPSNACWWASYSIAHRLIWGGVGCYCCKKDEGGFRPGSTAVMAVQGV